MDAQYPFASRDDIWRVFEDLKELHAAQFEQAERIARLERRRDEDARLKSVWGPLSPFPSSVGGTVPTEPVFQSTAEAFKGFDQGQHHGVGAMGIDTEDEPRRGTSRANSVRFDESAIHGYYGQANRSSSELPIRTGSGMGSLPLSERSLSHRSDGRQSSSGHSHHSARTNSLGLETTSRMMSSILSDSPLIPPPGLFLLGPVPAIIRCWMTTNFSNDSLLYAAICSGSYKSSLGYPMIQQLGLLDQLMQEGELQYIKLPMYLPEASVHQASSRSSSPEPQVPTLTIRFLVHQVNPSDHSVQIILGSDILRAHNADILFSQDKIIMVDDHRNKISIPLVRPEKDSVFNSLQTASRDVSSGVTDRTSLEPKSDRGDVDGHLAIGVIGKPAGPSQQTSSAPSPAPDFAEHFGNHRATQLSDDPERSKGNEGPQPQSKAALSVDTQASSGTKVESAGVWGSWKRDAKIDPNVSGAGKPSRPRAMKVLRPSKPANRNVSAPGPGSFNTDATGPLSSQPVSTMTSPDESRTGKPLTPNPIGGASAFPWLKSS
ncbi:ubiquitin carboxyl-terminal hydrolase 19 [Aspergillus cavernicola]|uniref:Ubiquitin carboxyl-terminal hydrolase 19 n=1 Tax=Aspergillus cavernicola TaxID=176166 RepID=A0ABR4J583_9EURO